jgi:hypothetical protein
MNELEEIDMTTDEALISALTPKQVGDIELQPFSLARQAVAMALWRGQEAHFLNIVVTVWVCTLEPREALKALADITDSQMRALEWAEGLGYSITYYQPLLDAYKRLNDELAASSRVRLRGGEDGDAPKNAGGRPPQ